MFCLKPCKWSLPDRPDNDNFLGMRLWRRSFSVLPPQVAARLLLFTMIVNCFQAYCRAGESGITIRHIKMPQSSLFLSRISCFSWINTSWRAASLWWISRVLKKLIMTVFASFSLAFIEMRTVEGPYSSNFADIICYLELLESDILGDYLYTF